MADTFIAWCKECDTQIDVLDGDEHICDECAEKNGVTLTNHYEETITHRENNSGLI